jgi:hypothetical protein
MRERINQLLEELGAESFAVRKGLGCSTHHIIARRSEGAASVTVEDYIERPYWLRTSRPAGRVEIEHLFHHLDCEVWKHQEFARLRLPMIIEAN